MMEAISSFLLAILQGVTEFLPVSSSGHLVIVNSFFPTDKGLMFDLVLHVATLISVCAYYWRDICQIFMGCIHELKGGEKPNLYFVGCLLLATVITGTIGLCLNDIVETRLRNLIIVGSLLVINAGILWSSRKRGLLKLTDGSLNLKTAALIGLAQGIAVLPGISRSGSTITAALLMGVDSKECAKISFLLSIPVILGALVLHIPDMANMPAANVPVVIISAILAAVVGYISLVLLNKILKKANFHHFAPYCLIVGIGAILWGIFG